jgi:hypothetical protein
MYRRSQLKNLQAVGRARDEREARERERCERRGSAKLREHELREAEEAARAFAIRKRAAAELEALHLPPLQSLCEFYLCQAGF